MKFDQPIQVPAQRPPVQQPAQHVHRDDDVKAVLRQSVATFAKMLDSPDASISQCTNTADCIAKVPGLKIPPDIKINLAATMHEGPVGEAGRAGSGRSYLYYDGQPDVITQNKEADQYVIGPDGFPTPIP